MYGPPNFDNFMDWMNWYNNVAGHNNPTPTQMVFDPTGGNYGNAMQGAMNNIFATNAMNQHGMGQVRNYDIMQQQIASDNFKTAMFGNILSGLFGDGGAFARGNAPGGFSGFRDTNSAQRADIGGDHTTAITATAPSSGSIADASRAVRADRHNTTGMGRTSGGQRYGSGSRRGEINQAGIVAKAPVGAREAGAMEAGLQPMAASLAHRISDSIANLGLANSRQIGAMNQDDYRFGSAYRSPIMRQMAQYFATA